MRNHRPLHRLNRSQLKQIGLAAGIAGILGAIILLGVDAHGSTALAAPRLDPAAPMGPVALQATAAPHPQPLGMHAITVLPSGGSGIGSAPAVTVKDTIQWSQSHPMPYTLNPTAPYTVTGAACMSAEAASQRLHGESIGLPATAEVCVVDLRGTFVFPGPGQPDSVIYTSGVEVFDAKTGNLILWGGV